MIQERLPGSGTSTKAIALGDVDGDGLVDVLVGNEGRDQVILNDESRIFSTKIKKLSNSDSWTNFIAVVDVDGDGD